VDGWRQRSFPVFCRGGLAFVPDDRANFGRRSSGARLAKVAVVGGLSQPRASAESGETLVAVEAEFQRCVNSLLN